MMADDVTYEWVDGPDSGGPHPATREEWEAIDARLVESGWMSLNRTLTRVLLAKRDREIVGFHVMQLLPHAEPLYVAPTERGTKLASELADRMVEFLKASNARGWMVLAGNAHTEKLCRERGMKKIASSVYMTQ
jgi:GNAT superfamily N-acetyltransferase